MRLFEDLIEELKEENLIEETVIETSRTEALAQNSRKPAEARTQENSAPAEKTEKTAAHPAKPRDRTENFPEFSPSQDENDPAQELEFYRRRAVEEVASLQVVEHIISGVEREQMKIASQSYDDISVNMALHDFLQISENAEDAEHSLAEFKLLQETENWYSALSERDKQVSVGDLRCYCENARPGLSAQALIALGRFYRNAPFSPLIRSKFELVMTRLVTKEHANHLREVLFERSELARHLAGLYADWSSIPLYAPDDDTEILLSVLKFEDFCNEINNAQNFGQLINSDFFNRFRVFKDNTGENFFSPRLTAAAIEANVIVGNRYVELITAEREANNANELQEKYKNLLDGNISEAASKTLRLVNILNGRQTEEAEETPSEQKEELPANTTKSKREKQHKTVQPVKREAGFFASRQVNKYLLLAALLVILAVGGLYVWVEFSPAPAVESQSVIKVDLENSVLKEFFKTARVNEGTCYAVAHSSWKNLPKEARESVLKKALEEGRTKGYSKVHVFDADGKTAGYASSEKGLEISEQNQ